MAEEIKTPMSDFDKVEQVKDTAEFILLQDGVNARVEAPIFEQKIIDKTNGRYLGKTETAESAKGKGDVSIDNNLAISGKEVFLSEQIINKGIDSFSTRLNILNPNNIIENTLVSIESDGQAKLVASSGSKVVFLEMPDSEKYTIINYPVNTSGRRCAVFDSLNIGSLGINLTNSTFSTFKKYTVLTIKYNNGEELNPGNIMIYKGEDKNKPFAKYTDLSINTLSKLEDSEKPINSNAIYPLLNTLLATNIFNPINLLQDVLISQTHPTIELVRSEGSITGYCKVSKDVLYKLFGHPANDSGRRSGFVSNLNIGTKGVSNLNKIFSTDLENQYFVFGLKFGKDGVYLDPNTVAVVNDINQESFIRHGDYKEKINIQNKNTSSLMVGASFAYDGNVWYKNSYSNLKTYNKNLADGSGVSMTNFVKRIYDGDLYTTTTLDYFNHLVIYLSHNVNVNDGIGLRDTAQDYEPIIGDNYSNSQNWDYFIKKYYDDCYKQRLNPNSKYYQTKAGKPVSIVVFTHWHDGRKIFNDSIRSLRDKWGFSLIELDKEIGFKMSTNMPTTGMQASVNYAIDTEVIKINGEDVVFGWHPLREGKALFVQDRTQAIFTQFMNKL